MLGFYHLFLIHDIVFQWMASVLIAAATTIFLFGVAARDIRLRFWHFLKMVA